MSPAKVEKIRQSLSVLPDECASQVLEYLQFLAYKVEQVSVGDSEDLALWDAVEANRSHCNQNASELLESYKNGEDFLAATAND